jgi:peptide deformylase
MVRPIVIFGDPVLRAKCKPVSEVTDEVRTLAKDMIETMVDAEGVGLAAPQVGVTLQLAVVDVSHDPECVSYLRVDGRDVTMADIMPLVFINPKLELVDPKEAEQEGCLSFPELRAMITRPTEVKATLTDLDGKTFVVETDGLLSRAIQHETDHLFGRLFIDRMTAATKVSLKRKIKRIAASYTGK